AGHQANRDDAKQDATKRHAAPYSSKRYSPKSHSTVKNTASNPARMPIPFHSVYGSGCIRRTVTSVLTTRIGVSSGSNNSGSKSSRMRTWAEMADSAVPTTEIPRLPRKKVSKIPGRRAPNDTLNSAANTGSINNSVTSRNNVLAAIFAKKIANGSST